jgi:hypothetical protein
VTELDETTRRRAAGVVKRRNAEAQAKDPPFAWAHCAVSGRPAPPLFFMLDYRAWERSDASMTDASAELVSGRRGGSGSGTGASVP